MTSMSPHENVVAVNAASRIVLTEADDVCLIETFIDDEGEETNDPDEAAFAVGQLPTGRWFCADLSSFEPMEFN